MSHPIHTTQRLTATREDIVHAAEILRSGGTVAFPTETVYGLGANALDADAVARIFAAKERPGWDPVIVHVSDRAMLDQVAIVPEQAERLIAAFWPGPLTLLLPRTPQVPDNVTAGRPLVGVRMPAHPVALALIEATGLPIAAPSANRFGRTSPTTITHVLEDLDHRIHAVLDGGPTTVGVESTVIGLKTAPDRRPYRPLPPRRHHRRHARNHLRPGHPLPAAPTTNCRTTKPSLTRRRHPPLRASGPSHPRG